ncbi:MAG: FlgD immunoglobulin-like domain containing protein, partial [bacterium]
TGTEFQGYNFPNPFDLTAKRPALTEGGSLGTAYPTDTATVIRYGLPAAVGGETAAAEVTFDIYNLAGELVRTINDGQRDRGFLYYTDWDGKNDNNAEVASGVYFVIAKVGGDKKKVMKFAVIK